MIPMPNPYIYSCKLQFQLQYSLRILLVTLIGLLVQSCGTATITDRHEIAAGPQQKPTIIYVSDFDLDVSKIKSEPGILPSLPTLPGPLGNILPAPPGAQKDPKILAQELVESMSSNLTAQLTDSGLTAFRLNQGAPFPDAGWLVRGVFTEVNQGNQLRRAVIGFGSGKTDLQILVNIIDLSKETPKPFYQVKTAADSGNAPGAGPTIILGPVGIGARFVMAGKDLDANVKKTAEQIAAEIIQRIRQFK